jgi:hypothetical protein
MGSKGGPTPRWTAWMTVGSNLTWTWTCVIALQIAGRPSRQRGRPTWKEKVIVTQRKRYVTSGHSSKRGLTPRRTVRLTVGSNITWTWTCVIALQIIGSPSRQRWRPTWSSKRASYMKEKVIVIQRKRNVTSGHSFQKGPDTKTNCPTDRR